MRQAVSQATFADLEFLRQGITLDPVLTQISRFLDDHPDLALLVEKDLTRGLKRAKTGRPGITTEQTLRAFILWRIKDWPYRELRERFADGFTLRLFTRFGSRTAPKYQAFQRSFSRLQPETVRCLNEAVVRGAVVMKIEDGTKLRVDTTVVETDVHYPTDSTLLCDGVRTISRLVLEHLEGALPALAEKFPDRRRRARRRMQEISRMRDRRGKNDRAFRRKYRDLVEVAREVVGKAVAVVEKARAMPVSGLLQGALVNGICQQILHYVALTERVIDQTHRRVFSGEVVAAEHKLYSIFEPHTDLIKRGKARKPVEFGHKIFLAESAQGLITDYQVLTGNPADTGHVPASLERHQQTFDRPPEVYAGDRGFYSADNLEACQQAGVGQACIPQRGGKKTAEREAFERSAAFKKGQRFRAGIEGRISVLFRGRGMKRCRAEGRERFEVLVGAAVLANNLMRIAELMRDRK